MIQKIKNHMFTIIAALTMLLPVAIPAVVSAADSICGPGTIGNGISTGANGASQGSGAGGNCTSGAGVGTDSITRLAHNVVNIFSIIIGAVAVIMIIYGGFRYITSGGDSG